MKDFLTRPAWIEIDLDKFENNMKIIKDKVGEKTEVMSVVKSDAYRLGALPLSQVSLDLGINYYAVATLSEALSLRKKFGEVNILILGYTPRHLYEDAIGNHITLTIYSLNDALVLNELAGNLKEEAKIHIAFDSGMSRIGFMPSDEAKKEICEIFKLENINVEGIFSHFAACETDPEFTERQFKTFTNFIDELSELGCKFKFRHIANSHSVLFHDEYDLDMVRPGIIQFGYTDSDHLPEEFGLEEILSLKAQISSIREVKKGETVGYERFYKCPRDTKVVTLPLGYADAFPRILSEKIEVLINGKRCKQIGLICMDQMMIDVSDIDCKIGDYITIYPDIYKEAKKINTIPYELMTSISKRVPRIYKCNSKFIGENNES